MEILLGILYIVGIGIAFAYVIKDRSKAKKRKREKEMYYRNKIQYYDSFKREGDFRESLGRRLVQVTIHGGACELCKKWEGKVLIDDIFSNGTPKDGNYPLLSQAVEEGFLHNGCRHGMTTYFPELEENTNPNARNVSQKKNRRLVLFDEETGEIIELDKKD